ncbi:Glutathione-regulated potassium-efflux system protein KefC [Pseudovibrio axinellae]|uniref:Glutathione-regulated potassium-efflux system protein KefC n=1 Tax=Pseudovibrio axinellae TaxID=989403 RepID=A0A165YDQ0_9HYPH|nr:monovalent cation:proton antiporter-2 (CPA2) family protein [Pseudovibrio axinellae]KZL18749.1 Glutathione-regulated potassium-efflux system protein KefC [Pseudovibrio axinellae]SEP94217.1 monovalent cation:H+ antiporter-2, CPA2 family/glutathione-regulated potassium-efflux system protein KefB [Pseudovibrio axinellae]
MNSLHQLDFVTDTMLFLSMAILVVPLAKLIRVGTIVGYLIAGVVLGPWGIGQYLGSPFSTPDQLRPVGELGVIMLLFLIGLELNPSRLWALRKEIFGSGSAQVAMSALLIGAVLYFAGLSWQTTVIIALSLALSSTALSMRILQGRGEQTTPMGQTSVAILLFQDMMIVPILALMAIVAPVAFETGQRAGWETALIMASTVLLLVAIGRYLLTPMFQLFARIGAREMMTASALLTVLGAAALMKAVGLSSALGAFIAGVMLAESSFRHELEANVEPFRGLLLGFFFITVGMSIDLNFVYQNWVMVLACSFGLMLFKCLSVFAVTRVSGHTAQNSLEIGGLLAQAGEFGFVIFSASVAVGLLNPHQNSLLSAIISFTMAFTLLSVYITQRLGPLLRPEPVKPDIPNTDGDRTNVLVVGFGRFGQLACQMLIAQGSTVTVLDVDAQHIREASRFGYRIFYGDGKRLNVLRAAGAENASIIAICTERAETTSQIVRIAKSQFPLAKIFARARDRRHAIQLLTLGTDYQLRETLESALEFGREILEALGEDEEHTYEILAELRRRDAELLALQQVGGLYAGYKQFKMPNVPVKPLTRPKSESRALNEPARRLAEAEKQSMKEHAERPEESPSPKPPSD